MDWETVGQIALLMLFATILINTSITHKIDKKYQDALRRKESGTWLGN